MSTDMRTVNQSQTVALAGLRAWLLHPLFIPAVLGGGLLIRLLVAVFVPVEQYSDFSWYVTRAKELAQGLGYAEGGIPTAYWPIGWPGILAGAMFLTGSLSTALIGLNLAGAAITMLLLVWFGRHEVDSEVVARGALFAYAVYPNHIAYVGVAASEIVYTALLLAAFALLIPKRPYSWRVLLSGAIFGIATLVKPQTILFPFGALIILALVHSDFDWRRLLRGWVLVYIGIACVVLPWSVRNVNALGHFVLVSTNGGTALFLGANDEMQGGHYEYQETQAYQALGILWSERVTRQVELDRRQKEAARRWIVENPLKYIAWMPAKVALLWIKDTDGFWSYDYTYPERIAIIRTMQALNQLLYIAILSMSLFCALAVVLAFWRRSAREYPLALLFCAPIFVTLQAAFMTGQIRYHFVAMPFLFLAAAWTCCEVLRRLGFSILDQPSSGTIARRL